MLVKENIKKIVCEVCGREISASNLNNHLKIHINPSPSTARNQRHAKRVLCIDYHESLNCKFCDRLCKNKNSLYQHERLCKLNPDKQESPFVQWHTKQKAEQIPNWNKGLTKETDERVAKMALTYKERVAAKVIRPSFLGKHHTEETKQKLRTQAKAAGGNINPHPNKNCKTGTYLGVHYDSSWELAFFVYQYEHGKNIQRNKQGFPYIFNNEHHLYFPDFIIDGEYYEIKNYRTEQVDAKTEQFPSDLVLHVLYGRDIKEHLNYCKSKYGKNFWEALH